jgi:septum formation protein
MTNADMKLVLASQSPRRRDLLKSAGYSFEVIPPRDGVESGSSTRESPQELVARLAYQKAADVAGRCGQAIIIGCDTVAECDGQILGKPSDRSHARHMLKLMSGRTHHVYSGLCLWRNPDKKTLVRVEATKLEMAELLEERLEEHLDGNSWQGKAGAFGFQEDLDWVRIIVGSESNVVGLPMELFAKMLAEISS